MSQLIKHYFINRDNGKWAIDTKYGLTLPNIKGLQIVHQLEDNNGIPYCLSTCPEYFEYSKTVSAEGLEEYQNDSNITIVSSTERQEEFTDFAGVSEEPQTIIVYDVVYQESYNLTPEEGLWIITQDQWDVEISNYDSKQQDKRYDILRADRDKMLSHTDWIVTKAKETGTNLTAEFKTWRQSLRQLPNNDQFPTAYPTLPSSLESDSHLQELYSNFNAVRSIPMINDPLPLLPEPELPGQ